MCAGPEIIALTQLVITAASVQQQQAAQQQQIDEANRIAQENARIAKQQFTDQIAQLNEKNRRIREQEQSMLTQATDAQLKEQVQALEAKGTAITATGEAGVEGVSPMLQLQDIERQQLKNIGAIRGNVGTNMRSLQLQREGLKYDANNAYYNAVSRINSMPGAFGQSATANALQYASAGLDAGTTYYKLGGRFGKKYNPLPQELYKGQYSSKAPTINKSGPG